eukprot:362274-Chlamydomonas_euryale.AAC.5
MIKQRASIPAETPGNVLHTRYPCTFNPVCQLNRSRDLPAARQSRGVGELACRWSLACISSCDRAPVCCRWCMTSLFWAEVDGSSLAAWLLLAPQAALVLNQSYRERTREGYAWVKRGVSDDEPYTNGQRTSMLSRRSMQATLYHHSSQPDGQITTCQIITKSIADATTGILASGTRAERCNWWKSHIYSTSYSNRAD